MAIAKDTARTLPEMEPPERRIVRLTIPARAEYITLCRLALTGLARLRPISEELVADLKLALTEATSNSVRHAYGEREGIVEIAYELYGDRLVIEVNDDGEGFDHDGGRRPRRSREPHRGRPRDRDHPLDRRRVHADARPRRDAGRDFASPKS